MSFLCRYHFKLSSNWSLVSWPTSWISRISETWELTSTGRFAASEGGVFPLRYYSGSILTSWQDFSSLRSSQCGTPSHRLTMSMHCPLSQLNCPILQLVSSSPLSSSNLASALGQQTELLTNWEDISISENNGDIFIHWTCYLPSRILCMVC